MGGLCSPGRTRTSDMAVNSRPLYRLSYRGVKGLRPLYLAVFSPRIKPLSEFLSLRDAPKTAVALSGFSVYKCDGLGSTEEEV